VSAAVIDNNKNDTVQISLSDDRPHSSITNSIAFEEGGSTLVELSANADDTFNIWNSIAVSAGDFRALLPGPAPGLKLAAGAFQPRWKGGTFLALHQLSSLVDS
jgi:hypothetical protein